MREKITIRLIILDVISSAVLGFGILLIVSPIFLMWWIHGSYDRYVWIINGPAPYSMFGGGPFQLFMYAGLAILGFLTFLLAVAFKLWIIRQLR